jgi:phosphatidate cytidylyltransferase
MDYKNLFNRLFLSSFFFVLYFIALNNKILIFFFATLVYLFVFYEIFKFFNTYFKLILIYLFSSFICFILYFFIFFDFILFNIFIFTIIFFDSFSFFIGKFFGKNYPFKYLSPNKTLEGYIGGFFFTNLFLIVFIFLVNLENNINTLILLLNFTIFFSIIGDLIESYFKRKNNLKDSSKYLPGHGGFFDRFDSFIGSILFLTLFSLF